MYNYIKIVLLNVLIPMENWPLSCGVRNLVLSHKIEPQPPMLGAQA